MTNDEFLDFCAELTLLGEALGENVSPVRFNVYFDDLRDYPLAVVVGAIREGRRAVWRFFPKPVEIRSVIEGDPETQATLAWTRLSRAIRSIGPDSPLTFGDPAMHASIVALGGWRDVVMWDLLPTDEQGYRGVQFRKLYLHYRAHAMPETPEILNDELVGINALRQVDALGLPEAVEFKALPPADTRKFDPQEAADALQRLGDQVGGAMERMAADPGRSAAVRTLGLGDKPLDVAPTEAEQADHARRQEAAMAEIKALTQGDEKTVAPSRVRDVLRPS